MAGKFKVSACGMVQCGELCVVRVDLALANDLSINEVAAFAKAMEILESNLFNRHRINP